MDDISFRQILDRLGYSWQGYAKVRKGVKKRISRHMQELDCHATEDYLHALNNPQMLKEVERLMSVSISYFFRDRYLWQALGEEILPGIIGRYNEKINVWSAGCALGQEVYSFAILWDILSNRFDQLPKLQIRASDINSDYLERARGGIYSGSSLKGLSDKIKATYFLTSEDKSNYLVADCLKKNIQWEVHDLLGQPITEKFQIILLRNSLLTYYRKDRRTPAFLTVLDSLDDGGFFIIGSHEKLPCQTHTLLPFKGCSYILQKT